MVAVVIVIAPAGTQKNLSKQSSQEQKSDQTCEVQLAIGIKGYDCKS